MAKPGPWPGYSESDDPRFDVAAGTQLMARLRLGRGRPHRADRRTLAGLPSRWLFAGGFLLFSALILVLVGKLLAPFVRPLLWAGVLTILVYPLYRWLVRISGGQRLLAATLTTSLLGLCVVGPMLLLAVALARESRVAYEGLRATLQAGGLVTLVDRAVRRAAEFTPGLVDEEGIQAVEAWLRQYGASALSSISGALSSGLNRVVTNASAAVIRGFVTLAALFYFLREGQSWMKHIRATVPLSPKVWDLVTRRFSDTLRAVVHGMLFSAAILAALLTIGFRATGVPLAAFFGMISFFVAPIPFVGVTLVWGPVCAWLYAVGRHGNAFGLFAYGAVVIFLVDNILRPMIIGSIAQLPVLFMLLSILGGLLAYGPLGVFLGPVLLAIGMAVAGIYREVSTSRHL